MVGRRLVTLVGILSALAVLTAPAATADMAFEDELGDQRNTENLVAPDITGVEVSNTPGGLITFRVRIANHQTLPAGTAVVLLFDLDHRSGTGDVGGFESAVTHRVDDSGAVRLVLEHFDEDLIQLVEVPATGLSSSFADGVFTLTIPRRVLGHTVSFTFGMYAVLFDPDGRDHAVDDAPNSGRWTYELTNLPAPRLSTTRLVGKPGRPRAGRKFVVGTTIRRADTGQMVTAGNVTCTARIGKSKVRAVGLFAGGQARCAVTVPRGAKGGTLRGTITVRAAGAAVRRTFSYRVG